jgi:hypothetical protein
MADMVHFAARGGRPHLPKKRWDIVEKAVRRTFPEELRERFERAFLKAIALERMDRHEGTERGVALLRAEGIRDQAAKVGATLQSAHHEVDDLLSRLDRLDEHTQAAIEEHVPSRGGWGYDTTMPARLALQAVRSGPEATARLDLLAELERGAAAAAKAIAGWPAANPGQPASVVSRLVWHLGPVYAATCGRVATTADGPFARFVEAWHRLLPIKLKHKASEGGGECGARRLPQRGGLVQQAASGVAKSPLGLRRKSRDLATLVG